MFVCPARVGGRQVKMDGSRAAVGPGEIWVYKNRNGWFARADYACGGPYKTEEEAREKFPVFLAKVMESRSDLHRQFPPEEGGEEEE